MRTVDLAHAADAERAHDLVASDSRASGQGHDASRLYRSARGTLPAFMSTAEPVYVSLGVELRKMLGAKLYRQVVAYLDDRRASRPAPVMHPSEVPVELRRRPAG